MIARLFGALMLAGCSAPEGVAELSVTLSQPSFSASITQLNGTVRAFDEKGLVGKGTVTFTVDIGTVEPTEGTLDGFGTAEFTWTCSERCEAGGRVEANWKPIGANATIRATKSASFVTLMTSDCVIGSATSTATATNLSLFGTPTYFAGGAPIAAGTYRLKNNGGCLKYGAGQNWTVHAYANGVVSWWLVGETTSAPIGIPPGTVGFERVPGSADRDIGSFTDFNQCDAANRALPAQSFTHTGGKLGIWLKDEIYADNTAGEGGKNPSWTLSRITVDCP